MSYSVSESTALKRLKSFIVSWVLRAIYRVQVWLTGYTLKPTCPWCGAECPTDCKEVWWDGDCDEIECDECERLYERHVSIESTFATEKVQP
jgi:hypothetical protein